MDPFIFLIVITTIYLVLLFFDKFFKSCMHYPYSAFMHNTGLTVQFLRISWYTSAFNRAIFRFGTSWNKILSQSFSIGVIVTLILMPIVTLLVLITLFGNNSIGSTTENKITEAHFEILLPGINLPIDEIGYYICTLIVCSVIHEMGHALAAVIEDVPVTGFGFHIFLCIPIAYTEISSEHLLGLKCFKKLRVLCGGVWHNIILGMLCLIIYSTLGFIINPFYRINDGVIITEIHKNSPLLGDKGLFENDIITQINDCQTFNIDEWNDCLTKSLSTKPGYCVSSDFIRLNDESHRLSHGADGVIQCCDPTNEKQCCFEGIDDLSNDNPIEIPQHVCLDIRKTIEDSSGYCKLNCEHDGFCIRPLLRNKTTIFSLKRQNHQLKNVIYVGNAAAIAKTIKISSFIPKINYLSPKFGESISQFLKYNIAFSFGLALTNALPCFGLDGYHICSTIIHNLLVNRVNERGKREIIVILVTSLGTLMLFSSIIQILWKSTFQGFI